MKKLGIMGLMAVAGVTLIVSQPCLSQASQIPQTLKTYKTKPTFLPLNAGNTYLWNASHTAHTGNLKAYQTTTLTATKKVTMTVNGETQTYYAVKNTRKKLAGYVLASQVVAGHYVKGGFYSYPTKGILLSTVRYRTGDDATQTSLFGVKTKASLKPYTKHPSLAQMKKTLTFYNQNQKNKNLPTILKWRAASGVRVAMDDVWTTTNSADIVKVPMLEMFVGDKAGHSWADKATYKISADLAALNGKPKKTYGTAMTYTVPFDGLYYNFPSTTATYVMAATNMDLKHLYQTGYGPKHNLALIDLDGHPRYVATKNILSIANTKPQLKHGIWYTTQDPTKTSVKRLKTSRSKYYRVASENGFIQYHYTKGSWQPQYSIIFDRNDRVVQVKLTKATGTLADMQLSRTSQTIAKTTTNNAKLLAYLYKPVSYYTKAAH
ncbi:hypothetical protein [Lactiplantibacillus daowaiensis]|uniref:Extracellular protein n=1 Tax=Lactiplantibacillus daowaiensis TaxID=2559918 RepID=A0ABW1S424_9LACO|nr:hypothetical protein [Lactiplantibacillus daowaiensis]